MKDEPKVAIWTNGDTLYSDTANALGERILALIEKQPEVLHLSNPFDLFKVPGFECADLQPSLAQAAYSLRWAQRKWEEQHP